jgi:hypothetical protein
VAIFIEIFITPNSTPPPLRRHPFPTLQTFENFKQN